MGFGLLGLATGVAIGIVESALKDRWLYVASGPLAGKQFILYKPLTTIGSNQKCDIYLFKDNTILPQHGTIEMRGAQTFLRSDGPIFVSGAPARNRALQSGDLDTDRPLCVSFPRKAEELMSDPVCPYCRMPFDEASPRQRSFAPLAACRTMKIAIAKMAVARCLAVSAPLRTIPSCRSRKAI